MSFIISISFWNTWINIYNIILLSFNVVGLIAFRNLRLRIGGSPQDQVIYNVGSPRYSCHPFQQAGDGSLFGLTTGCLYMWRWDELNQFFNKTG
jgi:heparanase 1